MQKRRPYLFFSLLAALFAGTAFSLCMFQFDAPWVLSLFIGINAAAIITVGLDKSFSRSGSMRLPEAISYVVALLGGSPGTLLGMYVFKHKTKKAAFQFVLLLIFIAQIFIAQSLSLSW
jgi:uncharacterized membrane protein YsdA (DUF1294 family)